ARRRGPGRQGGAVGRPGPAGRPQERAMTPALAAGAVLGLGLFLLVLALIPRRPSLARQLAAVDAAHLPSYRARRPSPDGGESQITRRLGALLARFCAEQGWELRSLRANLALVGKSFESFLATKLLLAVFGLLLGPFLLGALALGGVHPP